MLDFTGSPPDLSLFVEAGDDVVFVCPSMHAGTGWRGKGGLIYVVVHRSHGVWTHVYRVAQDPRAEKLAVFIERVMPGDQAGAACDWARASFE